MSGNFKQFGDAAHLYARYTRVIDEVERIFQADVAAFLAAVRRRMQADLTDLKIEEKEGGQYLSWWIEAADTDPDAEVPYVWIERRSTDIVEPGILTVIAQVDKATDAANRHLKTVKSSLSLPSHCTVLDRQLFGLTIQYGNENPVEACAGPVLAVLKALHEAWVSWEQLQLAAKEPSRAKGKT
jgi:hypothetical protein